MRVDARLSNATFYDVARFDIMQGEAFSLDLVDFEGTTSWFSNNDQVLEILQTGNQAEVSALTLGPSLIWIFDSSNAKIRELLITVVAAIVQPVSDLGLSAQVVDKTTV